jgi:hypothetical protein
MNLNRKRMVGALLACAMALFTAGCGESSTPMPADAKAAGISTAPTPETSAAGKPATARRASAD